METSSSNCWSCEQPGVPIAGKSWLRTCKTCDVHWDASPFGTRVRDEELRRGRQLDAIANHYGLGNRHGLIDHSRVNLASPA